MGSGVVVMKGRDEERKKGRKRKRKGKEGDIPAAVVPRMTSQPAAVVPRV